MVKRYSTDLKQGGSEVPAKMIFRNRQRSILITKQVYFFLCSVLKLKKKLNVRSSRNIFSKPLLLV